MVVIAKFLVMVVRFLIRALCSVDTSEIAKLPAQGPGLLATNHTSNLEGPAVFAMIWPRRATALAKRELWENPFTGLFMKAWEVIPITRGSVDMAAIRACVHALKRGRFVGIAPEGTRSKDGRLQQGLPGAALLALRGRAPIYPVAQSGFTDIAKNIARVRKTRISIRLGKPFLVKPVKRATTQYLQAATDEIMAEIAKLLPPSRRGVYAKMAGAPRQCIEYIGDIS